MRHSPFSMFCRLILAALVLMHTVSQAATINPPPAAAHTTLPAPESPVILVVTGNIAKTNTQEQAHFDEHMLQALPGTTLYTHTVVTDGIKRFDGPLMRDLLEQLGARGDTVRAVALNNYAVDIPMRDFYDFDVMLATYMDGQALPAHTKGPIWIVYPRDQHRKLQDIRYDYRWVWQLQQLIVQ